MEKQPWLEIAEYTAIVGSVVGTVAAVKFQQLAYASAPLAVVVSLNLINRQRFQQQIKQYTSSATADVRQEVQPLFQQAEIPVKNVNLKVNLDSIPGLVPPTDQITSIASKDQELLTPPRQVPQKEIILELQSLTTEINQGFNKLASCLEPGDISNIKLEISTIKEHLQSVDINYIHSNIEQFKAKLNYLDEQHHGLPPAYNILALTEKKANLEQENNEFSRDFNNFIIPKIKQLESQQASNQQEIKEIKEQLNNLEQKIENLSVSPEANFRNVVRVLAPIQAHLTSIGFIPEQIAQLKADLQDLQEQVKHELRYAHHNGNNSISDNNLISQERLGKN